MLGSEIINFFHNIIDDTLDSDFEYELLNNAKEEIESERDWEMLKKKDATLNGNTNGNYDTEYALPDDFFTIRKIVLGETLLSPIPFEEQIRYKDISNRYFIDHANSKLHICGTISEADTIYIFYNYETDDIASGDSPVWPDKFHKLIAFKMAELYFRGIDSDSVNRTMAPQQQKQAELLQRAMVQWDMKLKLAAMDYSAKRPETDLLTYDNIVG